MEPRQEASLLPAPFAVSAWPGQGLLAMRLPSNSLLKSQGAQDIRFVCLLAAPEGIARFQSECPDVPIWTAAIDERLNDHGYIVPGLGDAGDRMFGTR